MTQSNRLMWIGFYPLLLAVQAGAVITDQAYSRALRPQPQDNYARATSGAADLLLLLLLPVLLAGALSVWASGGRSRLLVSASLAVFSLNIALPILVSTLPAGLSLLEQSGPLLRLAVQLGALLLAVLAVREAAREVAR